MLKIEGNPGERGKGYAVDPREKVKKIHRMDGSLCSCCVLHYLGNVEGSFTAGWGTLRGGGGWKGTTSGVILDIRSIDGVTEVEKGEGYM